MGGQASWWPHTYPASQPSQRSKRSSRSLRPHTSQKVGSSSSSSPALAFSTGIWRQTSTATPACGRWTPPKSGYTWVCSQPRADQLASADLSMLNGPGVPN